MVPLRILRKLQDAGGEIDLVLGTLTASLGDPSGQDKTRPFITQAQVHRNAVDLLEQVFIVLRADRTTPHFNHAFVRDMTVPEFLVNLCSKFTVARLMSRDAFRARTEAGDPIAMHELLVPLLQGWDSVHLGATLEVGGNDQLFNFQVARELQQAHGQAPEDCILTPIINGTDGRKMSKSFDNCIWLDDAPADVFGKTMSIPDSLTEAWAALLTDIDIPTLRAMHPMEAKKLLAFDLTSQLHGQKKARAAREHFERTVQNRQVPADIPEVPVGNIVEVVAAIRGGSNSQARQLVLGGGVKINGEKALTFDVRVVPGDIVQAGKRKFARVIG